MQVTALLLSALSASSALTVAPLRASRPAAISASMSAAADDFVPDMQVCKLQYILPCPPLLRALHQPGYQ